MRQGSIQSWVKRPSDLQGVQNSNLKNDTHMASTNSKSVQGGGFNQISDDDSPIHNRKKRSLIKNSFLDEQDSSNSKSDMKNDRNIKKLKQKNAEDSSDFDVGQLEDILNDEKTSEYDESEKKFKNNKKAVDLNKILNGQNKNKTPIVANKKNVLSQSLEKQNAKSVQIKKNNNDKQKIFQDIDEPSDKLIDQEDQNIGGGFTSVQDIKDALPEFLKEQNIRDINMKRPSDPGYDETTLYIPKECWKGFTPCMTQFWQIKQYNLEKILFFKLGKFYEIFYIDAIICQRILDLNWMGGAKKLHIGFPEKVLDKYLSIMVNHGYKVAVIEQTETPRMMEQRLQKQKEEKQKVEQTDKCIQRDIIEMVTRGTFQDDQNFDSNQPNNKITGYEPKYILAYKKNIDKIGVTFFDVQTLKIYIGFFTEKDQNTMQTFRTLLSQIRPVEVIQEREMLNTHLHKMISNSPIVPTFSNMIPSKCYSNYRTKEILKSLFGNKEWPQALKNIQDEDDSDLAFQSLGLAIAFLEDALICDRVITTGDFKIYTPEDFQQNLEHMVLDSQCLQHLEIVESLNGEKEGSLLNFIDHCMTPFGKRELKRWLLSPLMDIQKIRQRQQAVEDLMTYKNETDSVRFKLQKLPDIEKLLAKVFSYSIKQKKNAIYFEDVNLKKLKEFRTLLNTFATSFEILDHLKFKKQNFKSLRLKQLLSFQNELINNQSEDQIMDSQNQNNQQCLNGLFPQNFLEEIQKFKVLIVWKQLPNSNDMIPEPAPGIDSNFDNANLAVNKIKESLNEYLNEIRQKFLKDKRINFSHAKFRYEIEIPTELVKGNKKPQEFEFTSQKQGFERFHTQKIKQLVGKLEDAEENLKNAMFPFLTAIFSQFYEQKQIWNQIIEILTELDCLISLAITSGYSESNMVKPELISYEGENKDRSVFDIKGMIHPCVSMQSGKQFIPNDTYIDTKEDQQSLLLVTGPNMGGKSTILRQNCLAAILAQIGCFVPCQSFKLTPVDRIFTRLGASDRILEGKSTFYVEMEETRNVLQLATFKSLSILDELGRGTSTFDGYSIAHSVLNYLTDNIKCRCLFSTHYHMLLDDFRDKKGIATYHMAYQANEKGDKVTFLYKFKRGECPLSFGINVARMAGIKQKILDRANIKSIAFNHNLQHMRTQVHN